MVKEQSLPEGRSLSEDPSEPVLEEQSLPVDPSAPVLEERSLPVDLSELVLEVQSLPVDSSQPVPEEQSQAIQAEPTERLAQAAAETASFRDDLSRQMRTGPVELDVADQQFVSDQPTMEQLHSEMQQLQTENTRLQEDLDLYKQVGDGQQEAVQKLMERADEAQVRADAAGQQIRRYLLLSLVVLVISLASVAFAIFVVLRSIKFF